ncbi:hypothetical protein Hanom_Chr03g00267181 [Helianthus anomalus]
MFGQMGRVAGDGGGNRKRRRHTPETEKEKEGSPAVLLGKQSFSPSQVDDEDLAPEK